MSAEKIRQELEASRAAIGRDFTAFKAELDFVGKAKRSVVEKPMPWLGGAAFFGWLLAGRSKRRKKKRIKARARAAAAETAETATKITFLSMLIAGIRLLLPIIRPAVSAYAGKRLGDFAASKF